MVETLAAAVVTAERTEGEGSGAGEEMVKGFFFNRVGGWWAGEETVSKVNEFATTVKFGEAEAGLAWRKSAVALANLATEDIGGKGLRKDPGLFHFFFGRWRDFLSERLITLVSIFPYPFALGGESTCEGRG